MGQVFAQLWVSAQSGDGYFAGAQIIHVIVDVGDEIVSVEGEPEVTVGSETLRMVQGIDGRWHAYFADAGAARVAESTVRGSGNGLDFGTVCDNDEDANDLLERVTLVEQTYFDGTRGVAFPLGGGCNASYGYAERTISVLRHARPVNEIHEIGQSIAVDRSAEGAAAKIWPFVQLYKFNGVVEIRHDRSSVDLEYVDASEASSFSLDREVYPPKADVHLKVSNVWLNVDPTDRDSWTWDIDGDGSGRAIYRAFDSNSEPTGNTADVSDYFDRLGCDGSCGLHVDLDGVLEAVNNRNGCVSLGCNGANDGLVTLVETGTNTGVFVSYDSANESSLKVSDSAPRGTAATVEYGIRRSVVIGSGDASLEFDVGSRWASGTRTPVEINDSDANRNTMKKERLDVSDPDAVIPTITTGNPLTLRDATVATKDARSISNQDRVDIDVHSARALLSPDESFDSIVVDFGDMRSRIHILPTVSNFLNYDMRSLGSATLDISVLAGNAPLLGSESVAYDVRALVEADAAPRGLVEIPDRVLDVIKSHAYAGVEFELAGSVIPDGVLPLVVDVASFGVADDASRVASQVVRIELEETGDDTGIFAGTLGYVMANQLTVSEPSAYADLATISDRATIMVPDARDDVIIEYLDLAADGSERIISGAGTPKSHRGSVSFDRAEYGSSDTIVVTLRDADLNTNPDTIESYAVGEDSNILVLTLNGVVWTDRRGCDAPGPDLRLVETEPSSGVFVGQLKVPREWCDGESALPVTTANTKIGITYIDYSDEDGSSSIAKGIAPTHLFPLETEHTRINIVDYGVTRIETTVLGAQDTAFEIIVQVTDAQNTVRHLDARAGLVGQSGTARVMMNWEPQLDTLYTVEVFVWDVSGVALAEPAAPVEFELTQSGDM